MCECHKPPCPSWTSRWSCGHRTAIEAMVKAGEIDALKAKLHLAKFGVPMTPPSKVYAGQAGDRPPRGGFFE